MYEAAQNVDFSSQAPASELELVDLHSRRTRYSHLVIERMDFVSSVKTEEYQHDTGKHLNSCIKLEVSTY
jgi:hypothetical protein